MSVTSIVLIALAVALVAGVGSYLAGRKQPK